MTNMVNGFVPEHLLCMVHMVNGGAAEELCVGHFSVHCNALVTHHGIFSHTSGGADTSLLLIDFLTI